TIFENAYPDAHVHIKYLPEHEAVEAFTHDSATLAILPRKLYDSEEQPFKKRSLNIIPTKIAYDAVALIANKNPWYDSALTYEQVKKDKSAIGIIGVNWISNYHEKKVQTFLDSIHVYDIYPPDTAKMSREAFGPYQAYIALKAYPFIREIYALNSEGRSGLAMG